MMRYIIILLLLIGSVFAVEHTGEIIVKYKENSYRVQATAQVDYEGKTTGELLEIIDDLNSRPDVEFAQLNYIYRPLATPDDTLLGNQWSLLNASLAWDITTGSNETVIAFIDTGAEMNHSDLASKIVKPYNVIDDNSNATDVDWHGTHVSGIAAAHTNNSLGVAGVCWNCSIMPVKVIGDGGGSSQDVSDGIIYAVDNGADIISMSIGVTVAIGESFSDPLLVNAINYAQLNNVLVVAAAGNEHCANISYPAYFENTLSVASSNSIGQLSDFSNCGPWIDVIAPGDNILSTDIGNSYAYADGTSMSAPYVAGLAGLLLTKNSTFSPMQLKSTIRTAVTGLNGTYSGTGIVDIYRALLFDSPPELQLNHTVDNRTFSDWVTFNMTMSNITNYTVYFSPGEYDDNFTLLNFSKSNSTPVFRAPSDQTGTLKVVACAGECVMDSTIVTFNNSKITFPYDGYVVQGDSMEINVSVNPPGFNNLTLQYLDGNWTDINVSLSPIIGRATMWSLAGLDIGQYTIRLLVDEDLGNYTVNITINLTGSVLGNITTDLQNSSIEINGSSDISKRFTGILNVSILSNGTPVVDFLHDFTTDLNLSNISVFYNETLSISGIHSPKIAYLTNASAFSHICIKDALGNMTPRCRGEDEFLLACDNTTSSGYLCEAMNLSLFLHRVSGLNHSSVRPQDIRLFSTEGNVSNTTTNLENFTFEINGTENISDSYLGIHNISMKSNNETVVEFEFDFSSSILNFTDLVIAKQNQSDTFGALVLRGINTTNKTIYLDDVSSIDHVCIKDSEDAHITAISSRCNGADETIIECDNVTDSGYRCEELNGTYRITGLSHTAIKEQAPYVAPPKKSSSSSSSSSSSFIFTPPCVSNYTCSDWTSCDWTESHYRICHDANACNSTNITEYRACAFDFCNDGVKNKAETDVDCGGDCSPCVDGGMCAKDDDCVNDCINQTCNKKTKPPVYKKFTATVVANCSDGLQNQDEQDTDCGGVCSPCISDLDWAPYLWGIVVMMAILAFVWIIFLYKD